MLAKAVHYFAIDKYSRMEFYKTDAAIRTVLDYYLQSILRQSVKSGGKCTFLSLS